MTVPERSPCGTIWVFGSIFSRKPKSSSLATIRLRACRSARPCSALRQSWARSSASAARKRIVARLEDFGFLEKIEPNTHMVPHGDRSGTVIEPYLTDQWYVDAKTMAQPAIAAVRRARRPSCRKTGKRPISSGWRTSSPGASRASSGGAIRYRRGTGRTARCSSPKPKKKRSATRSAITSSRKSSRRSRRGDGARPGEARKLHYPRRRCARHLVLLGAVAVLDAGLARRDAGGEALLPDRMCSSRAGTSSSSGSPG